jgi:PAS domain S-box-containing protein
VRIRQGIAINKNVSRQRSKSRARPGKLVLCSLVCLLSFFYVTILPAQPSATRKRVLVLYWDNKDFPGNVKFDENFKRVLASSQRDDIEYYPEFMETTRFPGQNQAFFRDYLQNKYADRSIDVVVAMADIPLDFLEQYRAKLFPNAPIVFVSNEAPPPQTLAIPPGLTGVVNQSTRRQTLELALKLQPDTKQVFVISGDAEHDKKFEILSKQEFRGYENRVAISYLTDLPLRELIARTAALPRNSIVIYIWQQVPDEQGRLLETYETLDRFAPFSAVPIYGMASGSLGHGLVGGYLQGPDNNGARVAEMVLQILNGARAENMPVERAPAVPMFDWRQLQRWGINERDLPPGSVIQYKQLSAWEQNKWYIIGAISAILLEALLIARLLYTQLRRRQAEEGRKRQTLLAQTAHRRLDEIVSNVPGIVWETKTDPVTGLRKTTFISDYVEKMLGYTAEEWLAQPPGFGARIMVEEDREQALAESERVIETGQEGFSQFRWRAKDGRIVWTENFLSPLIDSNQKLVGLRGVAIDISDRKSAEETVRQTKAKDRAILEAVPDLMFLHSPDGTYLDYHCKDVTGLLVPPEKFLGKNVRDVLPPDLAQKLLIGFEHAKENADPYLFEYELPINGTRRWYEARMVASAGNVLTVVRDMTERKQAVEALRQSEERFRMAQQAARVGAWEWNVQTGASVWSDMIWTLLGITPGNGPSTIERFIEIIHPADRERVWQKVSKVLENGNADYYDEFRVVHPDGQTLWLSSKGRLFRSADGTPERMIGVNIDINERKLAEENARQTQEKDAAILAAIPDLMFLQSRDGVYLDYHCSTPGDLLVPPEDFLGKNMRDVLPADLAGKFADSLRRAFETGETQVCEYELQLQSERRCFEARIVRSGDNIVTVVRDVTQRVLSEEAIKTSEAQLSGIIGSAMDGIITIDENQTIVLFNESAERIFGCPASEAVGHSLDQLLPQRFRSSHREHIRKFGAQNNTRRAMGERGTQLHGMRRSGEEFPMEASISQIEVKGQKFFTVILRDITERKRATDDLRQSEERFSKAFRSNPQPMSITRLDNGLYIDVNESFLAMSGYERSEVVGHTSLDLGIWMEPDHRRDFMKRLIDDGSLANIETIFVTRSGFPRTLLSSAERVEINGKDCVLMASSDITERVQAQQALKESEARFRNMADTAPVMIWVAGIDKGCYYFNQQWLDFTGRTMAEQLGDGWVGGIHAADLEGCLQMYSAAFDSREPFRMEYRLRRADGAYRWVIDSGTPRFSPAGKFLGYIGSCVDITDRKESEAAVVEAHEQLVLAHEEVSRLKNQLQEENIYLQEEIKLQQNFGDIVGASDALKYVLFKIEQVAPTDSTVLITGETGTGKELVARAIHMASARRDRPMVKVNCAALSASLIESELFGHERGAFTGALNRKIGRFELADGATIFLDEIGELPLELQVKLLRIIQEGEFERLGSSKTVKGDVRIIAATNRNLKDQVNQGLFREDLWYRLNVFPITVPPLRQRREDIPMLVEHFSRTFSRKLAKEITSVAPATINALRNYSWPGNVRELANVIERAVINAHGPVLRVQEQLHPVNGDSVHAVNKTLEEVERDYIIRILEDRGWKIEGPNGAAHVLGMNPSTLRTRMAKLAITKPNQNAASSGANR